jgi:thiamine transport system ATP-binding protein
MLTLDDLIIEQGDFRLTASWSVPEGSVTAIVGPSGGGKSTLLSMIGGYFAPTSGRIFWSQTDIGALPPGKRPVSTLFQDNNLFPHLTVAQNVGLALKPDLRLGAEEKRRVEAALAEVGLEGFAGRKPGTLSGGQASRAALARVLLQSRPLILLDEPFSALGPAMRREMLDLVAEKLKGRTVLMVTHDPEDAKQIADLLVMVDGGVAHAPVATAEAFASPGPALSAYLGRK